MGTFSASALVIFTKGFYRILSSSVLGFLPFAIPLAKAFYLGGFYLYLYGAI
tara:strand:- start:244 stop:399 length:156 start_codon:yes stop_codon:yes gene_type:complete